MVWVTLQIPEEDAAFAEDQWWRYAYADRDDYLNALLLRALSDARDDRTKRVPETPNGSTTLDDHESLPF